MFTIYILNYSNYYTRVIRKEDDLSAYMQYVVATTHDANFYSGDGIDTKQTVRVDHSLIGDYLLVCDGNNIVSRWFIIDIDAKNKGTSVLQLHRDIVADRLGEISGEEAIIEKCSNIPTRNDIAIYNKEPGLSFNQIKRGEHLLPDDTRVAWIVGYVSRDFPKEESIDVEIGIDPSAFDIAVSNIEDWPLYSAIKTIGGVTNPDYKQYDDIASEELSFVVGNDATGIDYSSARYRYRYFGVVGTQVYEQPQYAEVIIKDKETQLAPSDGSLIFNRTQENIEIYRKALRAAYGIPETNDYGHLASFDGYLMKVGEGQSARLYRISVVKDSTVSKSISDMSDQPRLAQSVYESFNYNYVSVRSQSDLRKVMSNRATIATYHLELVEEKISAKVSLSKNRANLVDAPYDMFCMPYNLNGTNPLTVKSMSNTFEYVNSNDTNLAVAVKMFSKMGGGVYDVQIVPYCPLMDGVYGMFNGEFFHNSSTGNYSVVKTDADVPVAAIFWCTRSSFRKGIRVPESLQDAANIVEDDPISLKVKNETHAYRLVSPNYNGAFDFSVVENNGLEGFVADCTYKPYNPYIHVAMRFGGLYGDDYDDPRGLICNGDFSITLITSAWETYEVQNKNYENIFNRQIKSLELQNKWSALSDVTGALSGSLAGVAGGAFTGMQVSGGNPIGAAVGAAFGGAGSIATGALDVYAKRQLREDNVSLTKDTHAYQLGNIQAMPMSISKVSSISRNNKYVPFVEEYSCTEQETANLQRYIRYSGATINRIESIDYFRNGSQIYIKATLLKPTAEYMDFHEMNALAVEMKQGVYID